MLCTLLFLGFLAIEIISVKKDRRKIFRKVLVSEGVILVKFGHKSKNEVIMIYEPSENYFLSFTHIFESF